MRLFRPPTGAAQTGLSRDMEGRSGMAKAVFAGCSPTMAFAGDDVRRVRRPPWLLAGQRPFAFDAARRKAGLGGLKRV